MTITDGESPAASQERVRVLLPLPLAGPFDYLADRALELRAGDFVRVPLGARVEIGVVWDAAAESPGDAPPAHKLKRVLDRFGAFALPTVSRRFVDWVADYTMSAPGAVLRMTMSVPDALAPPDPVWGWALAPDAPNPIYAEPGEKRLTPGRRRVLAALADGRAATTPQIAAAAQASTAVVRAMAGLGWLVPAAVEVRDDGRRRRQGDLVLARTAPVDDAHTKSFHVPVP